MDPEKVSNSANESLARRIGFMVMQEEQSLAERQAMFSEINRLTEELAKLKEEPK